MEDKALRVDRIKVNVATSLSGDRHYKEFVFEIPKDSPLVIRKSSLQKTREQFLASLCMIDIDTYEVDSAMLKLCDDV